MNGHAVASPIDVLVPLFQSAPFNLAPERAAELQDIITKRNINFQFDRQTHEMRFEGADLFGGLGLVCVGMHGLERLWAHAYGAVHVYRQFQAVGFHGALSLNITPEGRAAGQLMSWALQGELGGDPAPWPQHLPQPCANPADDQAKITNEIFLGAAGFAVLHEIGHVFRSHRGDVSSRDIWYRQEFEADEWAFDWVMDRWRDFDSNPAIFKKRAVLIAVLFALIAVNHVYRPRQVESSKHPNTIDRLLRFLVKHANEDSGLPVELIWAVAGTAIHIHLSQVLGDRPLPEFNSWRVYFNSIRDVLDRPQIRA